MKSSPVTLYVTYNGGPQSRFDREYYVNEHLSLVMKAWHQYGLLSVAAFFPVVEQTGTITLCECCFHDEKAIEAAMSAAETPEVMADVSRFTDLIPARRRAFDL